MSFASLLQIAIVLVVSCCARVVLGVESGVDFSGTGERGEAVDWLGVSSGVGEAHARKLVLANGLGVGRSGQFLGGLVEMSAEVADGGCAGVGPDAAAEGDVLEDVDALVCESSCGVSVTCCLFSMERDDVTVYLLAFCLGSSPSIAA